MGLLNGLFGAKKTAASNKNIRQTNFEDWSKKRSREELIAQMKDMFKGNFLEYEIACEYPAFHLDPYCHPACTPIQFMFKKQGENKLAVVIVRQNTYRGLNVMGTKKLCEERGIPYIRFFEEQPNEKEYVISRISEYL